MRTPTHILTDEDRASRARFVEERAQRLRGEKVAQAPSTVRTDGPTVQEFVDAGFQAINYPPSGYAQRSTQEEIDEAIAAQTNPAPAGDGAGGVAASQAAQAGGKPWDSSPAEEKSVDELTPEKIDGMTKAEITDLLKERGTEVNPDPMKAAELKNFAKKTLFPET